MRRSSAPELLDDEARLRRDWLGGNLADMARYNRWTGAYRLIGALLAETLGPPPAGAPAHLTGLDVGVGQGDLIRRAGAIAWTGLDASPAVLAHADVRAAAPRPPLVCALAQRLPLADGACDLVVSAHTLHHLDPGAAVAFLRECARVARRGVVIVDLARGRLALAGAWALTRATSRNPLTLNDGVQSVRRAYTPSEVGELAQRAGWVGPRVRRHGVRLSLTLARR